MCSKLTASFQISASHPLSFPKNSKRKIPALSLLLQSALENILLVSVAVILPPQAAAVEQNAPALPGGLLPPTHLPAAPWAAPRAG